MVYYVGFFLFFLSDVIKFHTLDIMQFDMCQSVTDGNYKLYNNSNTGFRNIHTTYR